MKKTIPFFIFLFLISCLGQISSDVYLPSLPIIRDAFATTENWMQFTLAIYMLGFSLSQLIYGPVSDNVGRKKPLIIGICICIIGTLLCRFSPNIETFIIGRFLQGVGAGSGAALFLSILRDVYQGNQLAKASALINISRVFLLASAPLIGSYLLRIFEWRACFTFLIIYAGVCLIGTLYIFTETNPYLHLKPTAASQMVKNILSLLSHRVFMGNAFCVMLAFGGILAWLTTLPFLLQDVVGLTPVEFGWVSAIAGLFFIVGGLINALWVERHGSHNMLLVGLLTMLLGSIMMLAFGLIGIIDTLVIMIPVVTYIIGSSFVFSNAFAHAMHPFSETAGTAGAVFGFLQILGGAISSFLMSAMHSYNQIPLGIVLLLSALIALGITRGTKQLV
jgi:Bcr/CflA subfamily drug resistance transporter